MTLELKDVIKFEALEEENSTGLALRISGLAFHSSMTVAEVKLEEVDREINVKILLEPARAGRSGSFYTVVPINKNTDRITFGNDRLEVWRRR